MIGAGFLGLVGAKLAEATPPTHYFYVYMSPVFVEKDAGNPDRTDEFTIYVQAWTYGSGGTTPEGGVNKLEGTQSYRITAPDTLELEECYTDQEVEAQLDDTLATTVTISTLYSGISGISLYKLDWDGTVELVDGLGNVEGVVYKTDDESDLDDAGQVLIQGEATE